MTGRISGLGEYENDINYENAIVRYSDIYYCWIAPGGKKIYDAAEALALAKLINKEIKRHEANR